MTRSKAEQVRIGYKHYVVDGERRSPGEVYSHAVSLGFEGPRHVIYNRLQAGDNTYTKLIRPIQSKGTRAETLARKREEMRQVIAALDARKALL